MKTWTLSSGGVLGVSDANQWVPATAEQIYGSIVEERPAWDDLAGGAHGAATGLTFSPYPVDAVLVLHSEDARPAIRIEGRTQGDRPFPLSGEAVHHGHIVHEDTWHPVSVADSKSITTLFSELGIDSTTPIPTTLRQCLALRRAAADGEPVIDQLCDDILVNLRPASAGSQPAGVVASLYPYQVRGWQWLRFIISEDAGGILADEMGLGKTLQIISALRDSGSASAETEGSLVVAPGSLLENWAREINKFCPDLRAVKHHGSDRTGSPTDLRSPDVVITSYETAVRDLSLLRMIHWQTVVLDEAQNIRNPDTQRAKAVKQLRRQVSFAVTGTPIENRLRDLWSIMDFILPGYLGELSTFEAQYADNDDDASSLEPLISPVILRRRVQEVAQDLPPRIDIPEILELNEEEALAYEGVRAAIHREHGRAATLVSLTRLRQFCAHPALLEEHSKVLEYSKFQRLSVLFGEIFSRREKALVFTAFTAMADRIVRMAQSEFGVLSATIDGRLPIVDRQPLIDQFTTYQGPAVLALNPRAGGTGLNIAAANHVIQYNPEWNPAVEDQAAARAYRRGQERPVTIRRLIIAHTVEEVMDERLRRKRDVADSAIVGVRGEQDDYRDILAALTRSPLTSTQ